MIAGQDMAPIVGKGGQDLNEAVGSYGPLG